MVKKSGSVGTCKPRLRIRGFTALGGNQYLEVRKEGISVLVKRIDVVNEGRSLRARLAARNLYLSRLEITELDRSATEITSFPPKNIIEQPGWTGACFALPNGTVFAPRRVRAKRAFQLDSPRCSQTGDLDGWLAAVRELQGQHLAIFMLMVTFVAPLIQLTNRSANFGFELCGVPGNGKTTLLQLMASTIGNPNRNAGPVFFGSCNTTVNAAEQTALAHNDLPLLLDDATQFAAADYRSGRANQFKQFIMFIAQGQTKARYQGASQQRFRLAYVLTTNLPLADVVAELADVESGAAADRLLSLSLDLRAHGNFDFIPAKYSDGRAFAHSLLEGVTRHHGTAMPHFLDALVNHRATDEARLRAGIHERVEEFLTAVQADRFDGSEARVAEAIGLVGAAGELAQHYGVLPECFDCKSAALTAYGLHHATVQRLSPLERLKAYAASPGVRDLDAEKARGLTMEEIAAAPGFWKANRNGDREFMVWPKVFKRAFPDWRRVIQNPAVSSLMPSDGRHRGTKRQLRKGYSNDRFFCFRL